MLSVLLAAMDFSNAHEDEFNDWYDLEHLPERQRVPGFGLCERWVGAANPKVSVATYDLDTPSVLGSPAYRAIAYENLSPWSKRVTGMVTGLLRVEGEQILPGNGAAPVGAGGLLVKAMSAAAEYEAEFNEWYDSEHIPALAAVSGVLAARRFRAAEGSRRYVALYHLVAPEVQASAAWREAANSPWTERMRPHFRDHLRIVARRYERPAGYVELLSVRTTATCFYQAVERELIRLAHMPPSGLAIKYQEHARVAHAISCRRGQKASLQGSVEAPSDSNNLFDQNWTKWFQEKPENSGHFGRCYCPNKAKSLSGRE